MNASSDPLSEAFTELRPQLFGVAYRMTGSVADSEDILQEVYLAWAREDRSGVDNPAAYLTRSVVNRSRDLLGSAARRRERYVGPWLPEPLVSEPAPANAEAGLELAESLRMAFMLVLDRLNANERAVFILKDVFGFRFAEIAEIVGASAAACRKTAERARKKVRGQQPELTLDHARTQQVMMAFMGAAQSGDVNQLTALLREDAVFYSDGGGKVKAALNPVYGRDKIARFVLGVQRMQPEDLRVEPAWINDAPGLIARSGGEIYTCMTLDVDADGLISTIYVVNNPDKLQLL